jgi:hypothetical protein
MLKARVWFKEPSPGRQLGGPGGNLLVIDLMTEQPASGCLYQVLEKL